MIDDNNNAVGKTAYASLCAVLDKKGWKYKKDEEKLFVYLEVSGEDIPMDMVIYINEETQCARLVSPLPFKMCEDKRIEGAVATCAVSYKLADSSFDYDYKTGAIVYRISTSFKDSVIVEDVFDYMISCACAIVDKYNDLFLGIDRGLLSIGNFVDAIMG